MNPDQSAPKAPVQNEIRMALAGLAAVNPFLRADSAARVQMISSHISQALVIEGASTRRILTGIESELGKTTFSVKMPVDGEVLNVIEKFPRTLAGKTAENPLTLILFENVHTKEIDIIELPSHHCLHQHWGFEYKKTRGLNIGRESILAAGTILADTPAKDSAGNACLGTEANVAFMSVPGVIEDGVVISRSFSRRLAVKGIEKRDISWGQDWYPLNLYGDEHNYKPFPDIGELIHDTGLLFGLRRFDDMLDVLGMTPKALRTPVQNYDQLRYGEAGARVIDVNVIYEPRTPTPLTPVGMNEQFMYYYQAEQQFYRTLWEAYEKLKRTRRETLRISRRLHIWLVQARQYLSERVKANVKRMYQHQALDECRVEVTFEYTAVPNVPFKLTDWHGGKGVVCAVWDDERMPVDEHGNRADLIMGGDSTIKRMNVGRLYEQYINATSRQVSEDVSSMVKTGTTEGLQDANRHLLRYYDIVAPLMSNKLREKPLQRQYQHVEKVAGNGVYLHFPTDNPVDFPTMIQELRTEYPIHIGPVTYVGDSGNRVTTKANVLIASVYIMLLEKTGGLHDSSGVSSAKAQHFGIPACLTKYDKYASAARSNPLRFGESEARLFAATIGGEKTAELFDMSNSPATHKEVMRSILRAREPTNIPFVVDRKQVPMGGNRAVNYASHILQCNGIEFYRPDTLDVAPEIYRDPAAVEDIDEGLEVVEEEEEQIDKDKDASRKKRDPVEEGEETDDSETEDEEEVEDE